MVEEQGGRECCSLELFLLELGARSPPPRAGLARRASLALS